MACGDWRSMVAIASVCGAAFNLAAASMACYGPLLAPRAAVSQRFDENYEIVNQCDCPSHVQGAPNHYEARARPSKIGLWIERVFQARPVSPFTVFSGLAPSFLWRARVHSHPRPLQLSRPPLPRITGAFHRPQSCRVGSALRPDPDLSQASSAAVSESCLRSTKK